MKCTTILVAFAVALVQACGFAAAHAADNVKQAVLKSVPNLSNSDAQVRAKTIQELITLRESNQDECATVMRDLLLTNPHPLAKFGAGRVLGLFDETTPDNVPDLLNQLKASNDERRQVVLAHALSLFGADASEAAPILISLIEDSDDPGFQERMAFFLPRLGKPKPELVPKLIDLLGHDNSEVRSEVETCLVRCGPSIIPALSARLDDPNEHVRAGVSEVFENLEGAEVAVAKLLQLMKEDKSPTVRKRSMEALGAMPDAAPLLVAALSDRDPSVRWYAANGLQRMGDAADVPVYFRALWRAVPALTQALDDSDAGVRIWAVRTLARIGDKAQIQHKFVADMKMSTLKQALEKALKTLNAAENPPTQGEEISRKHDRKLLERSLATMGSS